MPRFKTSFFPFKPEDYIEPTEQHQHDNNSFNSDNYENQSDLILEDIEEESYDIEEESYDTATQEH